MSSISIPINLGVEDLLSEAVARRLLASQARGFTIGVVFNRGGNGYLRKTAIGWNRAAKGTPFFLLTDLDDWPCATALLSDWLPYGLHNNMIARIAVREVESWLLADSQGMAGFFGIRQELIPDEPDHITDPKARLISLASSTNKGHIRRRIVPRHGTTAKQGPDYNGCLSEFVADGWNVERARLASPSLDRCLLRLANFVPRWK